LPFVDIEAAQYNLNRGVYWVFDIADKEFAAAEKAGLSKILAARKAAAKPAAAEEEEVKAPPAEPCTASIPGVEVMDLEDAAKALWKEGIYAETGMGCTGPIVMMSDANLEKSKEILKKAGYIG
jgi:glycine reductase